MHVAAESCHSPLERVQSDLPIRTFGTNEYELATFMSQCATSAIIIDIYAGWDKMNGDSSFEVADAGRCSSAFSFLA